MKFFDNISTTIAKITGKNVIEAASLCLFCHQFASVLIIIIARSNPHPLKIVLVSL